jgi:dTDP-glucose 4,6-dehydratase
MRTLVTGGAGFIGSAYVRHLVASRTDETPVVVDALTYAGTRTNLTSVDGRHTFVEGDVGDVGAMARLLEDEGIEVIVHFAAESHNSYAVIDPGRFVRANVVGTHGLLEAARRVGVERFHHVSTCEVYGDLDLDAPTAFDEDAPYRPRTPYSASKAAADHLVRAYAETYGLPVTITNCANNYGPHQFPEKLIPLFTTNAILGRTLPLYASTDHRREWIHVDDHCRAIDAVIERGRLGATYHVGTGVERSIDQIADAVLAALDLPADRKEIVPDRPGHDRRYLLDSSRIRLELGWEPEVEIEAGLSDTVAWYVEHRAWWEPLLGRVPVAEATAWREA